MDSKARAGQSQEGTFARALVGNFHWRTHELGQAPGVPQPVAPQFLLAAGLGEGTPHAAKASVRGLDTLCKSELYDSVEGGFFVACEGRRWKEPVTAKPLALNGEMVAALTVAAPATGRQDFLRLAGETAAWIDEAIGPLRARADPAFSQEAFP